MGYPASRGAIDTVDEFSHSVVNDSDLYDRFANTGNGHQEAGSKNNEDTINPWGTETVTVSIRQEAQPDYNTTQVVQAGLAYWETNSETYTNHTISYELTQETEDSDIVIEFNTEIDSCGLHSNDSNIAGCADFIQDRAPSVTNVQVELVENEEFAVLILKHELGHTLGLTHTDAPQAIMNATSPVVPNQEQRLLLFDAYTDGLSHYANGSLDFDRGTNAFNEGKYTAAIDHYQKSSKDFERGINDFRVAQKTAVNSELPEAADVCESAIRSAEHFNAAAEAMIRASELASVDDPAANDKVNEATESLENAQAINMDDGTKLAEILGIQLQSN